MKQLKIFRLCINFAIEILINIFFAAKKWCLSLWIYGKLEIIWWNFNTTKRSLLQRIKFRRYYGHVQKSWEVFQVKYMSENHDLYVPCDTLLLADVFLNFRDKCIEIYGLDRAHFLSTPGLASQACLKKRSKFRVIKRYWYVINC